MPKSKASTIPRPRTFAEPYRTPPPVPRGLVFPLPVLFPHRPITARNPLGPVFTHTPRNPRHKPRPVHVIPRPNAKSKPSRDTVPTPPPYRESIGNKVWRGLKLVLRAAHVMKPHHVTVFEGVNAMEREMAGLPPLRIHKLSRTRKIYRAGKGKVLRGKGNVDRKVAQKRRVWRRKQRRRASKKAEAAKNRAEKRAGKKAEAAKNRAEKRAGKKAEKNGVMDYATKRKAIMTGRRDLRIPHDPEARRAREAALKALKPEPDTASLDTVEYKDLPWYRRKWLLLRTPWRAPTSHKPQHPIRIFARKNQAAAPAPPQLAPPLGISYQHYKLLQGQFEESCDEIANTYPLVPKHRPRPRPSLALLVEPRPELPKFTSIGKRPRKESFSRKLRRKLGGGGEDGRQ